MIRSIVKQLIPYLEALNFADEVAGIVTPVTRDIYDAGNTVARKIYPIYENTPSTCKPGDYITCIPDKKYTS